MSSEHEDTGVLVWWGYKNPIIYVPDNDIREEKFTVVSQA